MRQSLWSAKVQIIFSIALEGVEFTSSNENSLSNFMALLCPRFLTFGDGG